MRAAERTRTARGRLALAGVLIPLALHAELVHAAFPGTNGRIAFTQDIWTPADPCLPIPHGCEPTSLSSLDTARPSGAGRREIYSGPVTAPKWSPDGRWLAFDMNSRLALIRGDGTGLRLLPRLTEADQTPVWSPDGRRLAFIGNRRCFGCIWLYTVHRDGTALHRVARHRAGWPAWSSTGRIAFVNDDDVFGRRIGLRDGIYSIDPDGSRLRQMFSRRWGALQQLDWAPDGSRIAFSSRNNVFTMRADGRRLRRLTGPREPRGQGSTAPAWSPDGKHIAFIRDGDLHVMRADGRGSRRVVDAPGQSLDPTRGWAVLGSPSWQPLRR